MTLPLGFRPRSDRERLRMAEVLDSAPSVVGLGFRDDGWTAACLRVGGRVPVWACDADPARCLRTLARLGLSPLGDAPPEAVLGADLGWAVPPVDSVLGSGAGGPPPATPPATREARRVAPGGPLVTILVCTYNRAALIEGAIASALAQSWPCELLVVDDGSTDGTEVLLRRRTDLRYVRQDRNGGKPTALARGLDEARGDAILVLDDDDALLPGAVEVLAGALFAAPEAVAAWGDTVAFDGATGRARSYHPAIRVPPPFQLRAVLQQIPAMPGATLVRAAAWRAAGAGDPSLVRGQDMDLFLRLARSGPVLTVPLPVFRYRHHDALRGSAQGQWRVSDRAAHDARFRTFVKPAFEERFDESSPVADRGEAHAWMVGLQLRGLGERAQAEAERWSPPYAASEAWARSTIGLPTEPDPPDGTLVVVDDGDEGALEAALATHARPHDALFVNLEVPRDPIGDVQLHWPGTYGARERLPTWVGRPGSWRLALSSAPDWAPPPLDDPSLLPDLPAPDAIRALAAALRWPDPGYARAGLAEVDAPLVRAVRRVRGSLDAGQPGAAMAVLPAILQALPGWRLAWGLAAEAFAALGQPAEAEACRRRA